MILCTAITCEPPSKAPAFGSFVCDNGNKHLSVCNYNCDPGFEIVGSSSRVCNDDLDGDIFGVWSEPEPTCESNLIFWSQNLKKVIFDFLLITFLGIFIV